MAFGNNTPTPKTTAADWTLKGTTAIYKNASKSAGYRVSNNQIVYSGASGSATVVTVTGIKSLDGITLIGKTIKIAASALNQSKITAYQ